MENIRFAASDYFKKFEHVRRIAKTKKKINNPYISIYYGPLLLALPIPDEGANKKKYVVPYNFALDLDPDDPEANIRIEKNPWKICLRLALLQSAIVIFDLTQALLRIGLGYLTRRWR